MKYIMLFDRHVHTVRVLLLKRPNIKQKQKPAIKMRETNRIRGQPVIGSAYRIGDILQYRQNIRSVIYRYPILKFCGRISKFSYVFSEKLKLSITISTFYTLQNS